MAEREGARRLLRAFVLVAIVVAATVLPWAPAPLAAATDEEVLFAELDRVHEAGYPPIPKTGPPQPPGDIPFTKYQPQPGRDCDFWETCADPPLEVRVAPRLDDRDLLLSVEVTWDPTRGNTLAAALFEPRQPPGAAEGPTYAMVKEGSSPTAPGRLEVVLANPARARYVLVVSSTEGSNTGWRASVRLTAHDRVPRQPPRVAPAEADTTAASFDAGSRQARGASMARGTRAAADSPVATVVAEALTPPRTELVSVEGAPSGSRVPSAARRPLAAAALGAGAFAVGVSAAAFRRRRSLRSTFRFSDLPLSVKLLVPYALLMLVIGGVGVGVTGRYLSARAAAELEESLVLSGSAVDSFLRDQEFVLLDAARYAANIEGIAGAVEGQRQPDAVRSLGSVTAVHRSVDVVAALADDGTTVAELARQPATVSPLGTTRWSDAPPVRRALDGVLDESGDKHSGFVRTGDGKTLLVVAAPLGQGGVAGAVMVGIDVSTLARGAADRSRAAVGLYDGAARVLASSDRLAGQLEPPPRHLDVPVRRRADVDGREVGVRYQPLVLRGDPVGTAVVATPMRGTFTAARGTALRLAGLVLVGMAGAVSIALGVRRSILSSVRSLLAANRALGGGDLAARAHVWGNDELGELGTGFNQMAERLQANVGELERRVAERTQELQRLYAETVAASDSRQEFFAAVSHEFRTPLFAIRANTELLLDPELRPDDPGEIEECITTIEQSTQRLIARVDEILAMARAEAGGAVAVLSPVDVAQLVRELLPMLLALARSNDVSLTVAAEEPAMVAGDGERLGEVVTNLVSNAVKYTPTGGDVHVTVATVGGEVQLTVADNGVGIPPELADRVFEPYYRVTGAAASGGMRSSGLGLAVTKRIVEAHGGTISHVAGAAGGTVFSVRLPAR